MNRATAGEDQDRSLEEGLEPLKLWVKRLIDGVIQDEFGGTELEFAWIDAPEVDPQLQAEIDDGAAQRLGHHQRGARPPGQGRWTAATRRASTATARRRSTPPEAA